jgi:hypothetical protein
MIFVMSSRTHRITRSAWLWIYGESLRKSSIAVNKCLLVCGELISGIRQLITSADFSSIPFMVSFDSYSRRLRFTMLRAGFPRAGAKLPLRIFIHSWRTSSQKDSCTPLNE